MLAREAASPAWSRANATAGAPVSGAWLPVGAEVGSGAAGGTLARQAARAPAAPTTSGSPSRATLGHAPVTVSRALQPDSLAAGAAAIGGGLAGGGTGGGASAGGAGSDATYQDLLHRLREEQEQLGRIIQHPF